ncbi:hypothetical protein P1X14_17230 [Sphingomonas sp. AOB5]|uniref:hypothetical protein n=1 Tax=Sphingomonas sp. AOB5 TaxID=3034017 RepID=UPI0023F91758|nr:hypothetical protein [Sphingomonas sp. AOB5]MDF7777003.1 hypothetical protein [Sphingomonas sp. AOB5]
MANKGAGEGERAERARRNRIVGTFSMLMLAGGVIGFATSMGNGPGAGFMEGPMPAWLAIGLVLFLIVSLAWGSWKFFGMVDELEMRANYIANSTGLYFYMALYMAWFILWRGTLVPEPNHMVLFATTSIVTLAAYGWKKLRP